MFPLLFQSAPHPANLPYAHFQQIIFKVIVLNFHPYFLKEKNLSSRQELRNIVKRPKDMGQV